MPLLGTAAMLLSFDVASEAIDEHDDWHTHEHLDERLSIPGFLRGTRWTATHGGPRYLVLYEVEALAALNSPAYLERLNHPSTWTTKLMPHYRGMRRGFCAVTLSTGAGTGQVARLLRFTPRAGTEAALRAWLQQTLPGLAMRPGLCGAHLLEGAATPSMTNEQRIRGAADAGVAWALLLTAYREEALAGVRTVPGLAELERRGADELVDATYRLGASLAANEVGR